jgi:hypothetical protein
LNISYTFLRTYKQCRRRAYLQYVKKVIPLDKIDCRNFFVGIVVDFLFKKWVSEMEFKEGWMENNAKALYYWFERKKFILYKHANDRTEMIMKTVAATQRLESCAEALGLKEKIILMQETYKWEEQGTFFISKVDMVLPEEKSIWDLKITVNKKYMDEEQMRFYAWIKRKMGDEVESAFFLSPMMKTYLVEADVSLGAVEEFEIELWRNIGLMKEGDWSITATDCWGCPVVRWCEEELEEGTEFKKSGINSFSIHLKEVQSELPERI